MRNVGTQDRGKLCIFFRFLVQFQSNNHAIPSFPDVVNR